MNIACDFEGDRENLHEFDIRLYWLEMIADISK